jgi:hypothetical protein
VSPVKYGQGFYISEDDILRKKIIVRITKDYMKLIHSLVTNSKRHFETEYVNFLKEVTIN